jgi:hypothetical protein
MMSLYEFKAAVHLNNTGVALLQRRCYSQAIETLRDAVAIMKIVCARSEGLQAPVFLQGKECSGADIPINLHEAAQRMANPQASTVEVPVKVSLQALSDDSGLQALLEGLTAISPLQDVQMGSLALTSNVAHFLRIEPADFEIPSEKDAVIVSSVIIYNFGMAYRCISSFSTACKGKLNDGVFHMFHLGYSILTSRSTLEQYDTNSVQFDRIQFVTLLLLRNLVDLSHQMGRFDDHKEYSRRLIILRDILGSLGAMGGKSSLPPAPAA